MNRIFDGWRPYAVLVALCLALVVPGLTAMPPMDRDEARYIQASKQMLETGDFVRIQYQDVARNKKPVGIYWAQAFSADLFGGPAEAPVWAYRLPSVIAAALAVLLTFHFGATLFGRAPALLGAAFLATSLMLTVEGHLAKTDAALLAATVAVLGTMSRYYLAGRNIGEAPGALTSLALWLSMGVGILIKGPIVPLIAGLAYVSLSLADKSWGWMRPSKPFFGLILVAAVVGPWFVAIQSATDGGFVGEAVGKDLIPKLLGGQESHGAWPGSYLVAATLTFWPASLFLWPALVRAVKARAGASLRFCLAWAVPAWIVFELVPTKLPHYTLPLYPALALITATAVLAAGEEGLFRHWSSRAWAVVWAVASLALGTAVVWASLEHGPGLTVAATVAAGAATFTAMWGLVQAWTGRIRRGALGVVAGAAVTLFATFAGVVPSLDDLWVAPRAEAMVRAHAPETNWPIAVAQYHEPSLVVLLGTETLLTDGAGAARHVAGNPGAVALVGDAEDAAFLGAMHEAGAEPRALASLDGFNYSRGKRLTLTLYEAAR